MKFITIPPTPFLDGGDNHKKPILRRFTQINTKRQMHFMCNVFNLYRTVLNGLELIPGGISFIFHFPNLNFLKHLLRSVLSP